MSTSTQSASQNSFQWMIQVGIDAEDVAWLERMGGSLELHSAQLRARVERIYTAAIAGMLDSPSAVQVFQSIQMN